MARARALVRRRRRDRQHDVAHVVDARVGDHSLEVRLREGDERPVERRDDGEHRDIRCGGAEGAGRHLQGEADEPVGAELEEHPGQYGAARRWGLGVRKGEPGMEREERRFDGEGDQECDERQRRRQPRERRGGDDRPHVEGARFAAEIERDDCQQQRQAAEQRVEEEGERRPLALERVVPPARDDEVHRDERYFPKHIEEHEIEREENAETGGFEEQEERDIGACPLRD